jgi:Tfp pilus assembly protein PilX
MAARSEQAGLATLMFTVVLLVAITSITFLTAKTLLTEQKIAGNDYRAKELAYAGEAALEYGIGWLNDNTPSFDTWNAADENLDGNTYDDLEAPNTTLTSGIYSYTLSVSYIRSCLQPDSNTEDNSCGQWMIDVTAEAEAIADDELIRIQTIRLLEDVSSFPVIEYIRVPGSWRDWQ